MDKCAEQKRTRGRRGGGVRASAPDLSREEIYSLMRCGVMGTVQFRNYHAYETPGGLSDR
jgi:hypothetical protein